MDLFNAYTKAATYAPHLNEDETRRKRWEKNTVNNTNPYKRRALEVLLDNAVKRWGQRYCGRDEATAQVPELLEHANQIHESATVTGTFGASGYLPVYIGATQRLWDGLVIPEIADVQPMPNGGVDGRVFVLASTIETDIASLYASDTALRSAIHELVIKPSEGATSTSIKPGVTTTTVTASEYKLNSASSYRLGLAFQSQFNMNLADHMTQEMIDYMAAIKNYAFLLALKTAIANDHKITWYTTASSGAYETIKSWEQTLVDSLIDGDNKIDTDWSVRSNTIVTDATGLGWFLKAGTEKAFPDFQPDDQYLRSRRDGTLNRYQSNYVGLFRNTWRVFEVFKTPAAGEIYLASKGSPFRTGGVYCPSVELDFATDTAPTTFVRTDGVISVCGWAVPVPSCYALVTPTAR